MKLLVVCFQFFAKTIHKTRLRYFLPRNQPKQAFLLRTPFILKKRKTKFVHGR